VLRLIKIISASRIWEYMKRPLQFSISFNSGNGPISKVVKLAKMAEENNLDCVWYCQDLFQRDVWVFLTAVASQTSKIDLGTGIVTPYTTNPAELAMHAATLDEYSRGRVRLGISVGAREFLKWAGIKVVHPISGMRESISIINRLLRGERVQHDGRVFKGWTDNAYLRFTPQRKSIPIYIGAQSPKLLQLTGEIADGGLPTLFPPEYFETVYSYIKKGAARSGRDVEEVDIAGCIWFSVSKDKEKAIDALRDLVTYYGPHLSPDVIKKIGLKPEDFEPIREAYNQRDLDKARSLMTDQMANLAIHGTPDECLERIDKLTKMGLRHIRFGPPLGPDPVETIKLLGEEIIPYMKENQ
jgi:5,10-methylenetetrahydromethanopterin reductase